MADIKSEPKYKTETVEVDDGVYIHRKQFDGETLTRVDGPRILDSGDRTEFESGAVRDMREGKGRCDLLPLDVVAIYLDDEILEWIWKFQNDGLESHLYWALDEFSKNTWPRYRLLLEVAKHFEEGAKKYGDNNWRKGIPAYCYIDSAVRHYLKFLRGDQDEPHDRAFCWNILCCIWTCKNKPELNTYLKDEQPESESKKVAELGKSFAKSLRRGASITNKVNECVCCGKAIPEGYQICSSCSKSEE